MEVKKSEWRKINDNHNGEETETERERGGTRMIDMKEHNMFERPQATIFMMILKLKTTYI